MTVKLSKPFSQQVNSLTISKLYDDRRHVGGLWLPNFIRGEFLDVLRKEVLQLDRSGKMAPMAEQHGVVKQKGSTIYLGKADTNGHGISISDLPAVKSLAEAYTRLIYNPISGNAQFKPVDMIASVGIHKYPAEGGGIGYHLDPKADTNLIAIFSVEGQARFSMAFSREGEGEISFTVSPGDLVLMRSHRNVSEEELKLRVFHKVESLNTDRYSVILRNRKKNGGSY